MNLIAYGDAAAASDARTVHCNGMVVFTFASLLNILTIRNLLFRVRLNFNVFGRNCDRAVQRSASLESLDQFAALFRRYPFHVEFKSDRTE